MKSFIYLIGSMDDFSSPEDLKQEYFKDPAGVEPDRRNMSVFPVVLSEACAVEGYRSIAEIAEMIARGEALSADWCFDGTFSILLEA
jgi:hypothetical protein